MFKIPSAEEEAEFEKFPAKRYIREPWKGIVESTFAEPMLAAIKHLRAKSKEWTETEEASQLGREIDELTVELTRKRQALKLKHEEATRGAEEALREARREWVDGKAERH